MSHAGTETFSNGAESRHGRGCGTGRSRWAGWEIAAIVGGFVVLWPVGLVALGVKLWQGEIWPGSAKGDLPFAKGTGWTKPDWKAWKPAERNESGNAAFEDYRKRELDRIEELRRKLDEDQKAFADFVARVRRAKDQDEFDRFMAERNAGQAS